MPDGPGVDWGPRIGTFPAVQQLMGGGLQEAFGGIEGDGLVDLSFGVHVVNVGMPRGHHRLAAKSLVLQIDSSSPHRSAWVAICLALRGRGC